MAKIKTESGVKNIELETGVDHELVGGFTLQMADIYVDASILRLSPTIIQKQGGEGVIAEVVRWI